jgi:hypothetical protein
MFRSMRMTGVRWTGVVVLMSIAALHCIPGQEELPALWPEAVKNGGASPRETRSGRLVVGEPDAVELAPVALDLGRWGTGEDGRRVWLGEELEYQIRWQGVPAGRALLRVKARHPFADAQGQEVWWVRLDVRSNRFLSLFFRVEGKTQSWMDVKGGFTRQYRKDQDEGSYRSKERAKFDYSLDKLEAIYEYPAWHRLPVAGRLVEKAPWRRANVPLGGKVLDPLSVVYYLRGMDLRPGQDAVLPVFADRRVWHTVIRVEAHETLRWPTGEGSVECLRLRPECHYNGLFERRGSVTLWVDARTKVVVRMTAETILGVCEAWLDRYECSPLN